jgi:hypothetical protein
VPTTSRRSTTGTPLQWKNDTVWSQQARDVPIELPWVSSHVQGKLDLYANYNDPCYRKNSQYRDPELLERPCTHLKWRTHLTWTRDIIGSLANVHDEDMIRVHIRWMKDLQASGITETSANLAIFLYAMPKLRVLRV